MARGLAYFFVVIDFLVIYDNLVSDDNQSANVACLCI